MEGTQPIREYAATLYLPAAVAKHLRYHNPGDAIRDEVLSFDCPLLWDQVASYSVQSPFNKSVSTIIPQAKMQDNPLLPAGSPVPVAELDFGFTGDQESFLAEIIPDPIEADFWAGSRKKLSLRLCKQPDGTVRYCEDNKTDASKKGFDAKRIQKIVEELERQVVIPGQSRALIKSSQRLVDEAAAIFIQRGWLTEQIHIWQAEPGGNPGGQFYLEALTD